jgi:hypothetical protein
LEASHDHLLVTPPSHFTPQKVRDLNIGFTGPCRRKTVNKILLSSWVVKEKIASRQSPFSGQIDDFHSNYCILKENAKNTTSGSTPHPSVPANLRSSLKFLKREIYPNPQGFPGKNLHPLTEYFNRRFPA